MFAQRTVEPELLDSLPQDHPDALHNRRDLRRLNALTGNFRWLASQVGQHVTTGLRLLEIGAGEGCLGAYLNRRGILPDSVTVDGLDVIARPATWPEQWTWHQGDLTRFDGYAHYDGIVANLILHQFDNAVLQQLGQRWRAAGMRLVLSCETQRCPWQMRGLPLLAAVTRMNYVSRHDAAVSLRGGFRRGELGALLGLETPEWTVRETTPALRSHRLCAVRHS
ncbi:MAG: class I SAM-dependent methyltransferase [Opitutales bacterium]